MSELLLFTSEESGRLQMLQATHQRIHSPTGLVQAFAAESEPALFDSFTSGRTLDFLLRKPDRLKREVIEVGMLATGLAAFVNRPVIRTVMRHYHNPDLGRIVLQVTDASAQAYGDFYASLNTYADAVIEANRQAGQVGQPPEALDVWAEAVAVCRTVVPECWQARDDMTDGELPAHYFVAAGDYLDEAARQSKFFSL